MSFSSCYATRVTQELLYFLHYGDAGFERSHSEMKQLPGALP
jgi:hypothetical protein